MKNGKPYYVEMVDVFDMENGYDRDVYMKKFQ